jgi:hypothetical protein
MFPFCLDTDYSAAVHRFSVNLVQGSGFTIPQLKSGGPPGPPDSAHFVWQNQVGTEADPGLNL